MICIVIPGPSYEKIKLQIEKAVKNSDMIELRFDLYESLSKEQIQALRSQFSFPMLFTFRNLKTDDILNEFIELFPEYIDLEYNVPKETFKNVRRISSSTKIISSFHDYKTIPENLDYLYEEMQGEDADYYKIAVSVDSSLETFKFLKWAYEKDKLIPVCMGEGGKPSRILANIIGSPITYASLDEFHVVAKGQISAVDLKKKYNFYSLNQKTKIYALLGCPVDQSLSDYTHNQVIKDLGLEAVYIKVPTQLLELNELIEVIRELPFFGLSITMPLKEKILSCLDEIDEEAHIIGAVNTLVIKEGKIKGYNTDGIGALDALERHGSVKGKKIVILGAGGAAKAIAFEAKKRGAFVWILNRTLERARDLAMHLTLNFSGLEKISEIFEEGYDILINTTPNPMPIDVKDLLPGSIVMDIKTRPKETKLLKEAKKMGCLVVYGEEMFIAQAFYQFFYWFGEELENAKKNQIFKLLEGYTKAL